MPPRAATLSSATSSSSCSLPLLLQEAENESIESNTINPITTTTTKELPSIARSTSNTTQSTLSCSSFLTKAPLHRPTTPLQVQTPLHSILKVRTLQESIASTTTPGCSNATISANARTNACADLIYSTASSSSSTTTTTTGSVLFRAPPTPSAGVHRTSSSSSQQRRPTRKRRVRYSTLELHIYALCLGDNPAVHGGLPLALDYHQKATSCTLSIDEYERARNPARRSRSLEDLRLNAVVRSHKLATLAVEEYSPRLLQHQARSLRRLQRQRTWTQHTPRSVDTVQYCLERLTRALWNATLNRRTKQHQKAQLQQWRHYQQEQYLTIQPPPLQQS